MTTGSEKKMPIISDEEMAMLLRYMERCEKDGKPQIIDIPPEEKQKIEEILKVFQNYIDEHPFFDIFYSKKFGYYCLDIDGISCQFSAADAVMEYIIDSFSNDVRDLKIGGPHMTADIRPAEETELRKRISPYIEKLCDAAHYMDILNSYVKNLNNSP